MMTCAVIKFVFFCAILQVEGPGKAVSLADRTLREQKNYQIFELFPPSKKKEMFLLSFSPPGRSEETNF